MKNPCPPVEALAELLELPRRDPRRAHLEACPRCRARVAAYTTFMTSAEVPGARAADAEARLGAAMDVAIGAGAQEARGAAIPGASRESALGWFPRILRTPHLRPGLALAAVVVVAGAVWLARLQPERTLVLRGTSPETGRGGAPADLEARPAGSGVTLTWRGVAGADGYEVLIYSPDLSILKRLSPLSDTSVVVAAADLASVAAGTALSWRVVALEQGDPAGESALSQFRSP